MSKTKQKYIGDNPSRGILYDWRALRRDLKKLEIPHEYYSPTTAPLDAAQWFVEVSERAVGKTNGWLLLGLCMYWRYGTVTVYARSKRDMIAPKNASSLYSVIVACGYISKLTDGKYNSMVYKARRWYLCHVDADGEIDDTDQHYCCRVISLDDAMQLKSAFNEPLADLLIYDEFIPTDKRYTVPNEFVTMVDVCSTIFRLRECCKVVLLANTLDKYNQYFMDLEIFERISEMQVSESCTHTTSGGTKVYVELIGAPKEYRTKKQKWTQLFAGFAKPELASITGAATWAVKMYQHIPSDDAADKPVMQCCRLYVWHQSKYLRLDIVSHPVLDLCMYVHWATRTYDDSIILTTDDITDPRYLYGIGDHTRVGKLIRYMIDTHKIYYAANDVGAFFESYLISCGIVTKNIF